MRQDGTTVRKGFGSASVSRAQNTSALLSDERFRNVLWRESKRSQRSRKHLVLTLIDHGVPCEQPTRCRPLIRAAGVLSTAIRETDIMGWFDANCVLGVIFTEFGESDVSVATRAIRSKTTELLQQAFTAKNSLNKFHLSFYSFPDQWLEEEIEAAPERDQVGESGAAHELLVNTPAALRWPSRIAALCSPSQRLRLD